jgi:hypothetical protein
MRTTLALVIAADLVVGCTVTPSDLPPCLGVSGSTTWSLSEAGADAGDAGALAVDGQFEADDTSNTQ